LITSGQIRAARSLIRWTGKELAKASGVAFSTLMRLETGEGVPAAQAKTLDAIQKAFEKAGIEFIGSHDDSPGIRIRTPRAPVEP
jgi:transcriptional regulator with XRE-family HTH domain